MLPFQTSHHTINAPKQSNYLLYRSEDCKCIVLTLGRHQKAFYQPLSVTSSIKGHASHGFYDSIYKVTTTGLWLNDQHCFYSVVQTNINCAKLRKISELKLKLCTVWQLWQYRKLSIIFSWHLIGYVQQTQSVKLEWTNIWENVCNSG